MKNAFVYFLGLPLLFTLNACDFISSVQTLAPPLSYIEATQTLKVSDQVNMEILRCTKVTQTSTATSNPNLVQFPIFVSYDVEKCGKPIENTAEYGVRFTSQNTGLSHVEMAPITFANSSQSISLIEHEAVGDIWSRNILSKSVTDGSRYTAQYDLLAFKAATKTFKSANIPGIHFRFNIAGTDKYCYIPASSFKMTSVLLYLKSQCTGTNANAPSVLSTTPPSTYQGLSKTEATDADEDTPKSWINGKQDGTTTIPPNAYSKTAANSRPYYIEYNPAKSDKSRMYATRRTDLSEFRAKGLASFGILNAPTSCTSCQ